MLHFSKTKTMQGSYSCNNLHNFSDWGKTVDVL